jgi:hypothetical protein
LLGKKNAAKRWEHGRFPTGILLVTIDFLIIIGNDKFWIMLGLHGVAKFRNNNPHAAQMREIWQTGFNDGWRWSKRNQTLLKLLCSLVRNFGAFQTFCNSPRDLVGVGQDPVMSIMFSPH